MHGRIRSIHRRDVHPDRSSARGDADDGHAVGLARMEKHFTGEVSGHSTTLFTYAVDHSTDVGGYVAMESFAGNLHERTGTFNFTHSATTSGEDRDNESFVIIPSSGTGDLAGITGPVG
jgi:hypothetical protein